MVSKYSKTNRILTIISAIRYKVSAFRGSDVAIKLEYIPHEIRYNADEKTKNDIMAVDLFVFLKLSIRRLLKR